LDFHQPFGPNGGWRWGNSTAGSPNFHTRLYDADFRAPDVRSDLPLAGSAKAIAKTYGWDGASRIMSIADIADATLSATYGYDGLDRLTSANNPLIEFGHQRLRFVDDLGQRQECRGQVLRVDGAFGEALAIVDDAEMRVLARHASLPVVRVLL